ncbi:YtcA family lipoprotein [Scandinavium lactucae]
MTLSDGSFPFFTFNHWSPAIMRIRLYALLGLPVIFSLSGCSLSPSLPFLGAAFPDWLYCLAGGAALFSLCGNKLSERFKLNLASWLLIAATFSMIIWLFIFS